MKDGFTLVEIMIVVAVIIILAALAVPNLLRSRISAQEAAATAGLRAIIAAETQYRGSNPHYVNLGILDDDIPPYIDSLLAAGVSQGYSYNVVVDTVNDNFYATAVPQTMTAAHTFYTTEGGVICRSDTINTAAPSGRAAGSCPANFSELQ
jgi:prepilin-type N-terminal cleavage/methylation domain-containing protein